MRAENILCTVYYYINEYNMQRIWKITISDDGTAYTIHDGECLMRHVFSISEVFYSERPVPCTLYSALFTLKI